MKTAIITGGAGGLGRALTKAFVAESWRVIVIDLPGPELDAARREGEVHACDLTNEGAVADTCARILENHSTIDMVIYNAGVTQIGPFETLPMAVHRKVMDVNYFGAVHVATHMLEPLRKSRGVHVAISSVAGFAPLGHRTAYAASKHALEGFFKTLRVEERRHGVGVVIAAPSFVSTNPGSPTDRGVARPGAAADSVAAMDADAAARAILEGVRRRRTMIPVGRVARFSWHLNRLAPRLFSRIMERRLLSAGKTAK